MFFEYYFNIQIVVEIVYNYFNIKIVLHYYLNIKIMCARSALGKKSHIKIIFIKITPLFYFFLLIIIIILTCRGGGNNFKTSGVYSTNQWIPMGLTPTPPCNEIRDLGIWGMT